MTCIAQSDEKRGDGMQGLPCNPNFAGKIPDHQHRKKGH